MRDICINICIFCIYVYEFFSKNHSDQNILDPQNFLWADKQLLFSNIFFSTCVFVVIFPTLETLLKTVFKDRENFDFDALLKVI